MALQADLAAWKVDVELSNFTRRKGRDGWTCSLREEALGQPFAFGYLDGRGGRGDSPGQRP